MSWLTKVWKTIEHNRYMAMFAVVYLALLAWVIGCSPHTRSIVDGRAVDAVTFEQEVSAVGASLQADLAAIDAKAEAFAANTALGREDLQRKAEFRQKVTETIGAEIRKAATGNIDPINAILSLLTLGGIGSALATRADNRRKDGVIETLKTEKTEAGS